MSWHERTIETYDQSSVELAEYFRGIGPRIHDIENALFLAENTQTARVVEIGCGDGRDALEIIKRVGWYEGVDPSDGLLDIARNTVGHANFVKADAMSYEYPSEIDVIFAFASLLHVSKYNIAVVFEKFKRSLREGGIAYISLKECGSYTKEVVDDEYGERLFYYYNPQLIQYLAGPSFEKIYEDHQTIGKTDWFTLALKKIK